MPSAGRTPCTVCNRMFSSAYLQVHMRVHTGEKPYQCSLCNKRFMFHSGIHRHRTTVHFKEDRLDGFKYAINQDGRGEKCLICNSYFPNHISLRAHMRIHKREEHQCGLCKKRFWYYESLVSHLSEGCSGTKFIPNLEKEPSQVEPARPEMAVKCLHCSETFSDDNQLAVHMKVHSTEKNTLIRCNICKKFFRNGQQLKEHVDEEHMGQTYTCRRCGKQFSKKFRLDIHMRSHFPGSSLRHSLSDRAFSKSREDKGPTKLEQCKLCHKAFKEKRHLILHMKTHNVSKKSIRCHVCNAGFDHYYNLITHSRIHEYANQRPFKCTQCVAGFSKEFQCKIHMARVHNIPLREQTATTAQPIKVEVHECVICWEILNSHQDLVMHMKSHKAEQPENSQSISNTISKKSSEETLKDQDTKDISPSMPELTKITKADKSDGGELTNLPSLSTLANLKALNENILKRYIVDGAKMTGRTTCAVTGKRVFMCEVCETTYTMKENFKRHVRNRAYDHGVYLKKRTPEEERLRIIKKQKFHEAIGRISSGESTMTGLQSPYTYTPKTKMHVERDKFTGRFVAKVDDDNDDDKDKPDNNSPHRSEDSDKVSGNEKFNKTTDSEKQKITDMKKMKLYKYVCDVCGLSYTRKQNMRQHRNKHTNEAFRRAGVRREDFPVPELDNTVERERHSNKKKDFDIYMDTDEVPEYEDMIVMASGFEGQTKSNSEKSSEKPKETSEKVTKNPNAFDSSRGSGVMSGGIFGEPEKKSTVQSTVPATSSNNTADHKKDNGNSTKQEMQVTPPNVETKDLSVIKREVPDESEVKTKIDNDSISSSKQSNVSNSKESTNSKSAMDIALPSTQENKTSIGESNANSSNTTDSNKNAFQDIPKPTLCPQCTLPLLEGQKTISCQLCLTRFCISCCGIPREVYRVVFENEASSSPLVWLCKVCKPLLPKYTMLLHQLGEFEESVGDRIAELDKKLNVMKNNQRMLLQSVAKKREMNK